VCVCNANICDDVEPVGDIKDDGSYVIYSSNAEKDRLERTTGQFNKVDQASATQPDKLTAGELLITVNGAKEYQTILGFGGAFTDAAGKNMNALSKKARTNLLKSYFDPTGIEYTVGRVPIASCDFSEREYSYVDTDQDFNLTSFTLADEDDNWKIPNIQTAIKMSNNKLKLFASPWSPPAWMKTNGRMHGWKGAQIKGDVVGPDTRYYEAYAKYFVRFFEEYAKRSVTFWGMTIQNEPVSTGSWQTNWIKAAVQGDFAFHHLRPALQQSPVTKDLKIIGHDDQRNLVFEAAHDIYDNADRASAIDGLGVHWYCDSDYECLTKTHNVKPEKFLLSTEACTGWNAWPNHVNLGDWSRGVDYGRNIINVLRNWVVDGRIGIWRWICRADPIGWATMWTRPLL